MSNVLWINDHHDNQSAKQNLAGHYLQRARAKRKLKLAIGKDKMYLNGQEPTYYLIIVLLPLVNLLWSEV